MKKKPVCVWVAQWQKNQQKTVMSVNGEIHNAYNLYIIKNTVIIVPRGNFTKEKNNF